MSTTVTEEQLNGILNDYTIHITGDASLTKSTHHQGLPATQNPPQWPTDRRRIPKFRPIDRTRTREERPNGSNAIEMAFLTVMFTGVVLNAVRTI